MTGGTIASCKLIDGEYKFVLIKSLEELDGVRGSKYVKSNPTGIYKQVKEQLIAGQKCCFLVFPVRYPL